MSRGITLRENIVSGREIAFFGFQAVIPACFALIPAVVYVLSLRDGLSALHRLADGTLILISFTMLISLSQDLQQAVRPYHRRFVAKIELMLRVFAICILAAYAVAQSAAIQVESIASKPQSALINSLLVGLSVYSFIISIILVRSVLSTLRPHFVDREGL